MANHGFLTIRNNLSYDKFLEHVKEVNDTMFQGNLTLEEYEDENAIGGKVITLVYDGIRLFEGWMDTYRKIEVRHNYSGYKLPQFLEQHIISYIGKLYNGTITDEGHGDKLPPDYFPDKYPTFKKFHDSMWSRAPRLLRWRFYRDEIKRFPFLKEKKKK